MTTTYLAFFDDDGGCQVEIHVHAPAEEVREWLTTIADFPAYRQPSGATAWFVREYGTSTRMPPRIELCGTPLVDPIEWMTDNPGISYPNAETIAWDVGPWCEITYDPEP